MHDFQDISEIYKMLNICYFMAIFLVTLCLAVHKTKNGPQIL